MKRYMFIYYTESEYYGCNYPSYFKTFDEVKERILNFHSSFTDRMFLDVLNLDSGEFDYEVCIDGTPKEPEDALQRLEGMLEDKGFKGS